MWGLALLVALIVLSGCSPRIEMLQTAAATPVPVATVVPEAHALAILAIDFDPPFDRLRAGFLDYAQIVSNGGVTLLVAVENRGLSEEKDVRVSARLLDGTEQVPQRELLAETVTIRSLPANELRVVCFTQVSQLPQRAGYRLLVQVEPVAGETDVTDNYRTYDILIHADD
jgi:hypothetical protein